MSKPRSNPSPRLSPCPADTVYYVNYARELVGEAPPPPEERRAAWERVLGLRPGEISPERVAYNARLRDNYIKQTLDEIFTPTGRGGGRRASDK